MRYLLDTCVVSELASKRPNPAVVRWVDAVDEDDLCLSVLAIGEIRKGIAKLPDSDRRNGLLQWLQDELLPRFAARIVPLDVEALLVWGELTAGLELKGRPMPAVDSLLAASALSGGFTLVTRNEADFADSGVRLLNPWRAA